MSDVLCARWVESGTNETMFAEAPDMDSLRPLIYGRMYSPRQGSVVIWKKPETKEDKE